MGANCIIPVVSWADDPASCLRASQKTVARASDILLARRGRSDGLSEGWREGGREGER